MIVSGVTLRSVLWSNLLHCIIHPVRMEEILMFGQCNTVNETVYRLIRV